MTTTSASSGVAAATTTTAIDVSAIGASLISGEKKPLDLLTASVTKTELVISDLASMKSKIATLQNALNVFEDQSSYATVNTTSSNASVITAAAANGVSLGSYDVEVSQTAESTKINVGGINVAGALSSKTVDATNFQARKQQ